MKPIFTPSMLQNIQLDRSKSPLKVNVIHLSLCDRDPRLLCQKRPNGNLLRLRKEATGRDADANAVVQAKRESLESDALLAFNPALAAP